MAGRTSDNRAQGALAAALAGLCLAALSACDNVRLPGTETVPGAERDGGAQPAPARDAERDPAPEPDPAPPTTPSPAPSPSPAPERPSQSQPQPQPQPFPGSLGGTPAPVFTAADDLLEINAAVCGLGEQAPTTPTVGQIAGATTVAEPRFGVAVSGGLRGDLDEFPGLVKLEPRQNMPGGGFASGHCGATRIARHWFVTAAHCIDDKYDQIRLIAGVETLQDPRARVIEAGRAICHGGYRGSYNGYANDLALLRIPEREAAKIEDVPLARFGATDLPLSPRNYPQAQMAGWGITGNMESLSPELLTATLTVFGAGPGAINIASRNGAGPCVGDSGGPLYVEEPGGGKTVVGVLSVVEQNRTTGGFCEGSYNGRYTNLQGYLGWIANVIGTCETNGEVCVRAASAGGPQP